MFVFERIHFIFLYYHYIVIIFYIIIILSIYKYIGNIISGRNEKEWYVQFIAFIAQGV